MKIGQYNELTILRFTAPGAYLGDDEDNDVLLPGKYITPEMKEGDMIKVFIYKDSEDRIVATTETPLLELNQFAFLRVKDVNPFGAFLDWGLEKDLLVPFREQRVKMEIGRYYLVTLRYDDATDRLYASGKFNKFIDPCDDQELLNQKVDLLIGDSTDLGVTVIVNDRYQGIIYRNDVNKTLKRGSHEEGYVYFIREDGKLDIRLVSPEVTRFDDAAESILEILKKDGILKLSDKSDPDDIRETVGMSKKMFKQAIGKLYKARLIKISDSKIELVKD
jgi:uncharacterized protein